MTPRLEQEDIHQLADRIWESMFGGGMELLAHEGTSGDDRFLTGCVQLTGTWEGVSVVRCSYKLASQLASMMMGTEDLTLEEVCDAVGELANLTAGAIQSLMPSPSELSPPSVVEGREYELTLPRCSVMKLAYFRFNEEPFTIMVYEAGTEHHFEEQPQALSN